MGFSLSSVVHAVTDPVKKVVSSVNDAVVKPVVKDVEKIGDVTGTTALFSAEAAPSKTTITAAARNPALIAGAIGGAAVVAAPYVVGSGVTASQASTGVGALLKVSRAKPGATLDGTQNLSSGNIAPVSQADYTPYILGGSALLLVMALVMGRRAA